VEEILSWAGDGEDDMAFKYNIIRAFEDERAEGKEEGKAEGKEEGMTKEFAASWQDWRKRGIRLRGKWGGIGSEGGSCHLETLS